MLKQYLVNKNIVGGSLIDVRTAVDLVKESGGKYIGYFPYIPSLIVECTDEVASALNLIELV